MLVRNDRLHMVAGGWELQAEPGRGGAITALRLDGRDVMVSPQPNPDDAMGSASFAMVPYANRIAGGRFLYLGQRWQLPLNFGDHPHPLHGTGWKRPWSVTERDHGSVTWELHHEADAHWPWPFTAHQTFRLDPEGLHIALSVTNEASCCVPVGVGFHPAFAAPPGTVFETRVEGSWTIDADIIPISPVAATSILPEIGGRVPLPRATLLDHCFTRWSRRLRILPGGDAGTAIEISASPEMEYLHLYAKPGADWFIAEPVSQMPDAIHHPEVPAHGGLRFLQPAETFSVWMRVSRARA